MKNQKPYIQRNAIYNTLNKNVLYRMGGGV